MYRYPPRPFSHHHGKRDYVESSLAASLFDELLYAFEALHKIRVREKAVRRTIGSLT